MDSCMSKIKPIAFYLPQYHPIPENDKWWGKGFTEWTNVSKGRPNFEGHYQPHIPRDLGFYDLRRKETLEEQASLAKQYGIHGFCFYWYWFDGKQLLQQPLYDFLENKKADINFCFCWANENWTRTWDGQEKQVLMKQNYDSDKIESEFIETMIPFFKDDRYIKVDGNPMLLVYRCDSIPNLSSLSDKWREVARKHGFNDLHLVSVNSFSNTDHTVHNFNASVEFPPHQYFGGHASIKRKTKIINKRFKGHVYDYRAAIKKSINTIWPKDHLVYRSAIPSWDNTARRQDTGDVMHRSSPGLFQFWLSHIIDDSIKRNNPFIFINAWNEWGEGCHLEPDVKHQHSFLEAVKNAVELMPAPEEAIQAMTEFTNTKTPEEYIADFKTWLAKFPVVYKVSKSIYSKFKSFYIKPYILRRIHILKAVSSGIALGTKINTFYIKSLLFGKNIKFIYLIEHIGDIVACEPIIRTLSSNDTKVFWIARKSYSSLFSNHPKLEGVIHSNCITEFIVASKFLLNPKLIYNFHIEGKCCNTCGFRIKKDHNDKSITLENYYNFGPILVSFTKEQGSLVYTPHEQPNLHIRAGTQTPPSKYMVIHRSSNEEAREWCDEKWLQLINKLMDHTDLAIIDVGDRKLPNKPNTNRYVDLTSKTSLTEVADLIANSYFFMGIDSSIAHFANAYKKPGLVLIGKYRIFSDYIPYTGYYFEYADRFIIREKGSLADMPLEAVFNRATSILAEIPIRQNHGEINV